MTDALSSTHRDDMTRSRAWENRYLCDATSLPITFKVDGTMVAGIPRNWNPTSKRRRIDANIVETVFEGKHPACGFT